MMKNIFEKQKQYMQISKISKYSLCCFPFPFCIQLASFLIFHFFISAYILPSTSSATQTITYLFFTTTQQRAVSGRSVARLEVYHNKIYHAPKAGSLAPLTGAESLLEELPQDYRRQQLLTVQLSGVCSAFSAQLREREGKRVEIVCAGEGSS